MSELPNDYQTFIHRRTYARWRSDLKRRETWRESVDRYMDFMVEHICTQYPDATDKVAEVQLTLREAIASQYTMPSMRAFMTAGEALKRDNVAGYNCAYLPVDSPRSFDEAMYILMCGTGVGFSVERMYTDKLPIVEETFHDSETVITVSDSKMGWAGAFRELLALLYAGQVPSWDVSRVRPAGAPLKTFGGRASGPKPLEDLFKFSVQLFKKARGRRLTPLECHELMCKVGEVVVVGGVRRSALISLSDISDLEMRHAKSGNWWKDKPHLQLSNNSATYDGKPTFEEFLNEWKALYDSHSGERGFFNREAVKAQVERTGRREANNILFGTNPCSEIILRPNQFCNLTEVVVRHDDDLDILRKKVELATILGTWQATLTNFRYLRSAWKNNCDEERLLGVSLTGMMDHMTLSGKLGEGKLESWLKDMRKVAVDTNEKWSKILGINQSTAITCVKPSGTVSQLTNTASGIHPRYAKHYIRRVQVDKKDPLANFLIDQGVPHETYMHNPHAYVFEFPMKSPRVSVTVEKMNAIKQLKHWKMVQDHWCEHKPSATVYYTDDEFFEVGQWVWKNFNSLSGLAFLPYDGGVYAQAPYEPITEEKYKTLVKEMPKLDWDKLSEYENTDLTSGSQELACTGNQCEL